MQTLKWELAKFYMGHEKLGNILAISAGCQPARHGKLVA